MFYMPVLNLIPSELNLPLQIQKQQSPLALNFAMIINEVRGNHYFFCCHVFGAQFLRALLITNLRRRT